MGYKNYQKCLNCEEEAFHFVKGYCARCRPLVLRIEKGILPDVLMGIKRTYNSDFLDKTKREYIRQLQWRLTIIKEAYKFKYVTAHDLEYRINNTLKVLDGKSLGKINDPLAHYLEDDRVRSYVYQLFTKIQLLKPFRIDSYRLYQAGQK